ncbi:MAG TPA: diphthine--ammonia ligase [Thermoplasmata archaeon]|nr:diphthine--ammonia ligase [Thermoplasmata archaeon]
MRVAALFSGGKDSTYAAYVAVQRGWDLTHLLSIVPADRESMLFHVPNLHLTPFLAEAMGRPLVTEAATPGEVGELDALRRIFRRVEVDGIVVGAIASDYQHERVNRIAEESGLRVFAPLWRHDPRRLVRDYLAAGFEIVFSAVAAEGLDASWLGRRWDDRTIEDLLRLQATRGVHPCGEGGEFETLVLDGPLFHQRLEVRRAEPRWSGQAGVWQVLEARLVPKEASALSDVAPGAPSGGP